MLILISGPSGIGKDTIAKFIMHVFPNTAFLTSVTDRLPREGDIGYRYVSKEEFSTMINRGVFAWNVEYHGNRYGTLISDISKAGRDIDDRKIYIAVISYDSVALARSYARRLGLGKTLAIFLYCIDKNILRSRLSKRGEKDIEKRINDCLDWYAKARLLPFFVFVDNGGDLEVTEKEVAHIIKEAGFLDLD